MRPKRNDNFIQEARRIIGPYNPSIDYRKLREERLQAE